jgi:hypothetical protein
MKQTQKLKKPEPVKTKQSQASSHRFSKIARKIKTASKLKRYKAVVLTTTDDNEWPMLINIVPIDRARSIYKTSLLQKYFQSLDMIINDLQVRIPTLAASLALPLAFK